MAGDSRAADFVRPGRYTVLLGSLLLFIAVLAATSGHPTQTLVSRLAMVFTLVAGLYAGSQQRWVFWLGLVLVLTASSSSLATGNEYATSETRHLYLVRYSTTAFFILLASAAVFLSVLRERDVSLDTILGGISVYLLIGIAFVNLYVLIEVLHPGAFLVRGSTLTDMALNPGEPDEFTLMFYFSFTTLTTLGYGDIHPVKPLAQLTSTLQAIVGQLYVAIFVARLVGLHLAQSKGGSES